MQKRIMFRLPDHMYQQVNEAVRQGKAKTPSELIRKALFRFIKESEELSKTLIEQREGDSNNERH